MRATRCLDWNTGKAIWAILGFRFFRGSFFFPLEFVDLAYEKKYRKGNDQEANDRIREHPVVDGDSASLLSVSKGSIRPGNRAFLQDHEKVREINVTQ